MPELTFNQIERSREIAKAREIYARQDVVQKSKKEEFIAKRADVRAYVLRAQMRAYSRYAGIEPKIDVVA